MTTDEIIIDELRKLGFPEVLIQKMSDGVDLQYPTTAAFGRLKISSEVEARLRVKIRLLVQSGPNAALAMARDFNREEVEKSKGN